MTIDRNLIGARFRAYREALGLTQPEVATAVDTTQTAISTYESGLSGGHDILIKQINYYNSFFDLSNLLDEAFTIKKKNESTEKISYIKREALNKRNSKILDDVAELEEFLKAKLLSIKISASTNIDI